MTNTELTLNQLQDIAGGSSFTTNPIEAKEQMYKDGKLFTYDELKWLYGRISMNLSERVPGYTPKYDL